MTKSLAIPLVLLLGTTALVAISPLRAETRVGVTSATSGDPHGKPPAQPERVLRIGIDVQANEVITTQANDRAHLVFLDGTSLTVGPSAQVTIDKFVYDPASKTGELAVSASKGVLRLVGGKISKTNAITVTTPSSTMGIRGGITMIDVQSTQTTATFVFGDSMTVTGQGHTQHVTRPGSQVTTTGGAPPGAPRLVRHGGMANQMSQLEGRGGGQQGGGQQGGGQQGGGQGGADQAAQNFGRQTSGQGPAGLGGPPGQGPNPGPGGQNRDPFGGRPPTQGINPGAGGNQSSSSSTTVVTVSRGTIGRAIVSKPYTGFDNTTLAVTPDNTKNRALASTGTQTTTTTTTTVGSTTVSSSSNSTITLTVPGSGSNTGTITLPYLQGVTGFSVGSMSTPFGTLSNGLGYVSASGDFFAYVFDSTNGKVGFMGGNPTPTSSVPTSGISAFNIYNAGGSNRLPFADSTVGDNASLQAAAVISKMYSVYSSNLSPTVGQTFADPRSTALQSTVAISGTGTNQSSYMGVFIGEFRGDVNDSGTRTDNGPVLTGTYIGSYRTAPTLAIGRLYSAESTPATGGGTNQGHAVYGTGSNAVTGFGLTPDAITTTTTTNVGGAVTSITTTTTSQSSLVNQALSTLTGTDYYSVNLGTKTTTPSGIGASRTDQTVVGYVAGLVESSTAPGSPRIIATVDPSGNSGTPDGISLTTSATNNRASATITLPSWNSGSGTSATFLLGSTTGTSASTSVFIDDKTYAARDVPASQFNSTTTIGGNTGTDVTSNTVIVSYNAAAGTTAATNPFLAAGITPCTCDFLTWGWWGGDISYSSGSTYNASGIERLNLATYVAGKLATTTQLPNVGTATFSGSAIGNVQLGSSSYVGVGTYTNSWTWGGGGGSGSFTLNFDSRTYSGTTTMTSGTVQFSSPLSNTSGGASLSGNLNGAFFQSGGSVAGQAGSFSVTGTVPATGGGSNSYNAGGTFVAKKQ